MAAAEATCFVCEAQFTPRRSNQTTTCTRECGWVWIHFKRGAKAHGHRISVTTHRAKCLRCGEWFSGRASALLCSDECRKQHARAYSTALSASKHVAKDCTCRECGHSFVPEYGSKRRTFCSDECLRRNARRAARKKGKARRRGATVETVDPVKDFDRDKWRCQACGVKTPRAKRGTYDGNAPELDHIVPLAKGGEHSYRNTQLLCRCCNGRKSDGAGGQLRLFG